MDTNTYIMLPLSFRGLFKINCWILSKSKSKSIKENDEKWGILIN
jgi:hypothetical protein